MNSIKKISIILAATLILLVSSAFAATVTINPNAIDTNKQWGATGCSGGNPEYQCVDEVGSPDTSDYLRTGGNNRKETFTFTSTGLSSNETINSVTMYYYAMRHNRDTNRCFEAMTRSGGTDYFSGTQICANTTWAYYTHTYSTNPATGSAWTLSEVEDLRAGMNAINPDGGARIAQVYAVVDYEVANQVPIAIASATPTSGTEPLDVDFDGSVIGGDGTITYEWNFGDGSANSSSEDPSHTYTSAGVYTAVLTVEDADGDKDSDSVVITVDADLTPTANITTATPVIGIAPLNVTLAASASGGNGPLSYLWDFGDGTNSSSLFIGSHLFTSAGNYTVTFTATDDDGDQDSDSVLITVLS